MPQENKKASLSESNSQIHMVVGLVIVALGIVVLSIFVAKVFRPPQSSVRYSPSDGSTSQSGQQQVHPAFLLNSIDATLFRLKANSEKIRNDVKLLQENTQ